MIAKDIQKIGVVAFHQSLHQLKAPRAAKKILIVGIDTEYDSETRELLCWTFSYQGRRGFYVVQSGETYDWQKLETIVEDFLYSCGVSINKRHVRGVKLICYFSVAESQHLTDVHESLVFETSVGIDFCYLGKGGRTLELVDLLKFFANPAQPLARVAESFGLRKLEWNTKNVTRADLTKPGFQDYAENDAMLAEVIFNRLRETYLQDHNVDIVLTKTPAQTSSVIYRLNFLNVDCAQPDTYIRKLALRACWGGRNEAYMRGNLPGQWYEYDAFSEYPNSVIQLEKLPSRNDWLVVDSLDDLLNYQGFARAVFHFPTETKYPCLPVFADRSPNSETKNGGKLYYPLHGETVCTIAELKLAQELGCDLQIVEGYCYTTGTDTLATYMQTFLQARKTAKASGDMVRAHVIKLAINSLIGKFVQRVTRIDLNELQNLSRLVDIPTHDLARMGVESLALLVGDLDFDLKKLHNISVGNSFYPEWNALILGYARAATSRFLVSLAQTGNEPAIASTDSVIFRSATQPPDSYTHAGIVFERREVGTLLQVVRTRLYRLTRERVTVKLAHHAMPHRTSAESMFDFWQEQDDPYHFPYSRMTTYRESVVKPNRVYGAMVHGDRQVQLFWDQKRALQNPCTSPWEKLP